jgi:4,5-DOPA dioxygenase extradiol
MVHDTNNTDGNSFPDLDFKMPALFVGHGNPMNAVEDTEFSRVWANIGESLPRPKAILCISAHWETIGTKVTAMADPRTIHDFAGFPRQLFDVQYAVPGSTELAKLVQEIATDSQIELDYEWGIDHGAWSVLCRMFPKADIPLIQLSLDRNKTPEQHYELGKALSVLRQKGVLIVGSGNIVHNLQTLTWNDNALDWASAFAEEIKRLILERDHKAIINYLDLGQIARLSVPTAEHFLPLLYILALQEPVDTVQFFTEKVTLGSISMRSVKLG